MVMQHCDEADPRVTESEHSGATIFALSSGAPPSAIAVIRISGPQASAAIMALTGKLPAPRRASLRTLCDPASGAALDTALLLWLPGPATATGEDLAEIHAHGGRAVVRVIEEALGRMPGLRAAQAGEFTRRALLNGRIDVTAAEGLADLLAAETEAQRQQALLVARGAIGEQVALWQADVLALSAATEALLDFADEDDVAADDAAVAGVHAGIARLAQSLAIWLSRPTAEPLRDGIAVVIAGPPNAGKSTLINALADREVAIVSPQAGTTRDVLEVYLAIDGLAFRFSDTAGLRDDATDAVEQIGIARAQSRIGDADILVWLGAPDSVPRHQNRIIVAAQSDQHGGDAQWLAMAAQADLTLSAVTGDGMTALHALLVERASALVPRPGEAALNARQRAALCDADAALREVPHDPLLIAEHLRIARGAFDRLTGAAGTEAMLDTLFGRFCIGK